MVLNIWINTDPFWTDVQVYRLFLNTNDLSFSVCTKNHVTLQFEILTIVGNQTRMKKEYPVSKRLLNTVQTFLAKVSMH